MFKMSSSSEWGSCEDRLADLCSSRHLQNHQRWTDMRFVQKICQRFLQWFFQRFFTSIGLTLALFKGFNQFTLDVGKTGRSDPCQDLLVELTTFIVGQSPKSWKLHFSSLPAPRLAQFEEKMNRDWPNLRRAYCRAPLFLITRNVSNGISFKFEASKLLHTNTPLPLVPS